VDEAVEARERRAALADKVEAAADVAGQS